MPEYIYIIDVMMLNFNTKIFGLAYKRLHKKYSYFSINHSIFYNSSIYVRYFSTSVAAHESQIKLENDQVSAVYLNSEGKLTPSPGNLSNPYWITGFTDAEGCFVVHIRRNPKSKIGWTAQAIFQINLHKKDLTILEHFKSYFGLGNIIKHGKDSLSYRVSSIDNLNRVILPHFDNYPLISQKKADYILFKQIVYLMNGKEHLTVQGLKKIIAIRASLNLGLSEELKMAFPCIVAVNRPLIQNSLIPDPFWLSGFASGESTFYLSIFKSETKLGESVLVKFSLAQSLRDGLLIKHLVQYLGCGNYSERFTQGAICTFSVSKLKDLDEKIIPFFDKYPIEGSKFLDYQDFKKAVILIKDKAHLTSEGLDKIRQFKSGMNKGRL